MPSTVVPDASPAGAASAWLDPGDPHPEMRTALCAWLRVQAAFGFAPQQACEALEQGVAPDALWRSATGPGRRRAASIEPGGVLWQRLVASGARAVPWTSPAYPERLRRLVDAPPLLLVQGEPAVLGGRAVAIVGARAASRYGRRIAGELARALVGAGVTVVSGLAYGIDASAHGGALDAGGRTVAVQGCGPDRVYPARHRALAERIRATGLLVTEFAPGVPPRAAHFPLRNRIISALAEAVVVVEARLRSGSLVTARHAADQGVDVLAVPGPIDAPTSEGPNRLLVDGARPVLGPEDLLDALGLEPGSAGTGGPRPAGPSAGGAEPSSPQARRVAEVLAEGPASRDALSERLGVAPHELALALTELELAGHVEEQRDGRLRWVHLAAPAR